MRVEISLHVFSFFFLFIFYCIEQNGINLFCSCINKGKVGKIQEIRKGEDKNEKKRKENAITLIALIITVIVMLILAGVAINLTIGENGIFKKSAEGAEIYKNSANDEASNLNEVDEVLGNLIKDIKKQEITNKGTIEYSIAWEQKKASVTLGTTSEYKLQYQVNGEEEGSWIEGTQVNELNLNDIVYARLYDGEVAGNSIKIVIEDVQQPNEASISFPTPTIAIEKPMKVTVSQSDNQSGVKIEECKWIFTTQKEVATDYVTFRAILYLL